MAFARLFLDVGSNAILPVTGNRPLSSPRNFRQFHPRIMAFLGFGKLATTIRTRREACASLFEPFGMLSRLTVCRHCIELKLFLSNRSYLQTASIGILTCFRTVRCGLRRRLEEVSEA